MKKNIVWLMIFLALLSSVFGYEIHLENYSVPFPYDNTRWADLHNANDYNWTTYTVENLGGYNPICSNYTSNHTDIIFGYLSFAAEGIAEMVCRNSTVSENKPAFSIPGLPGTNDSKWINFSTLTADSGYKSPHNVTVPLECLNNEDGFIEICYAPRVGAPKFNESMLKYHTTTSLITIGDCGEYPYKLMNFTVYDAIDNRNLDNYSIELLLETAMSAYGYSNESADYYVEICTNETFDNFPVDYKVVFKLSGYEQTTLIRLNHEIGIFTDFQNVSVLMMPTSNATEVTVTVVDENDFKLSNYVLETYGYNLANNDYSLVDTQYTNSKGEVNINIDSDEWYRFIVKDAGGETFYTGTKEKITGTTYTIRVTLGDVPEYLSTKIEDLNITLLMNRTKKNWTMLWGNISHLASEIILRVQTTNQSDDNYMRAVFRNFTDYGIMWYNISEPTKNRSIGYIGTVSVIIDGSEYLIDTKTLDFREEYDIFGDEALWVGFLFIGTMAFIGITISMLGAAILTFMGMFIFVQLGFLKLASMGLIAVLILLLILSVRAKRT